MTRSGSVNPRKIYVVIGLSSGVCPQVCCFRRRKDAEAHSKKLAKEMDFREEDHCPRTGNWHNDKDDIWIEEAELR